MRHIFYYSNVLGIMHSFIIKHKYTQKSSDEYVLSCIHEETTAENGNNLIDCFNYEIVIN